MLIINIGFMSQHLFLAMLVGSVYGEKFVFTLCFDIKQRVYYLFVFKVSDVNISFSLLGDIQMLSQSDVFVLCRRSSKKMKA